MSPHLGLQRIMIPSAQVSSLTTGTITLPSARRSFTQIGGYFAGGSTTVTVNTIQKLNFPDESTSTLTATLSVPKANGAPFSSSTVGYFGGAYLTSGFSNQIEKLVYATEVVSVLSSTIGTAVAAAAGFESSTAGYIAGGDTGSDVSTVTKVLFSNETNSNLGTGLSLSRRYCFGFSSSSNGYAMGGYSAPSVRNTGDKFNLSNDSRSTFTIPTVNYGAAPFANASFGYYAGGTVTGNVNTIRKMNFSDDSFTALTDTLSAAKVSAGAIQSTTAGYVSGGNVSQNVVDKILFSTDARTTLSATLPTGVDAPTGISAP